MRTKANHSASDRQAQHIEKNLRIEILGDETRGGRNQNPDKQRGRDERTPGHALTHALAHTAKRIPPRPLASRRLTRAEKAKTSGRCGSEGVLAVK